MLDIIKIIVIILILYVSRLFAQVPDGLYLEKNFDTKSVVASVDSINITAEEFFLNYEFGPAFTKKVPDSRRVHLDYMINEKLLALEGYSKGKDTSEEVKSMLDEFKNDIAAEEMFKAEILPNVKVDKNEVEKIIGKKQVEVELKWLFANTEDEVKRYINILNNGSGFDSLFQSQLNDTVPAEDRSMKSTLFSLEKNNPQLAQIVDSLKPGGISVPFHVPDGWYIVKLSNLTRNIITTGTEYQRLKQEAENVSMKKNMDSLSDVYVQQLMNDNKPVIKKDAYSMVRSYLGKMVLEKEKYNAWQLEQKLNDALKNLNDDPGKSPLVEMPKGKFSVDDFLYWYRNRNLYISLNDNDFNSYSASLEQLIWRMVRDRLIAAEASAKGYDRNPEVIKQLSWWKDKIVSSAVRNDIISAVKVESGEVTQGNSKQDNEKIEMEFRKKLLHTVIALKQKYKININKEALYEVPVSEENNKRAIEFYMVKTGGLIPRTPYPSINNEWVNWQ